MFKKKERSIVERIADLNESISWDEMDIDRLKKDLSITLSRVELKYKALKELEDSATA